MKRMIEKNITSELDFYHEFYASNLSSPITVVIFIYGIATGIVGPFSIIWFERNCGNRFRTVINQMLATASWYLLFYTLLVYIPDGIRFAYGPYGEFFCDIHIITQNILWPCLILTEDVMIVLRYIFVFYLKNFGIINDDLVARILNLSILTISIWTSVVRRFSPGRLPLHYYLCIGKDPNNGHDIGTYLATSPKYNAGRIITIVSLILHAFMVPRFIYNHIVTKIRERPIRIGRIQQQNQDNSNNPDAIPKNENNQPIFKENSITLFGLFSQLVALGCLLGIGIGIRISSKVEPYKWNDKEHQWIPMSFLIYAPILISNSAIILFFTQNSLQQTILNRNRS